MCVVNNIGQQYDLYVTARQIHMPLIYVVLTAIIISYGQYIIYKICIVQM